MSAPKGNQFWKIRSKHGRNKLFETPELLWEAACEYFEWCEKNPLKESQAKVVSIGKGEGSSIKIVELDKMRAMTLSGLCFYLRCNEAYLRNFKNQERQDGKDCIIQDIRHGACQSGIQVKLDKYENYIDSDWILKRTQTQQETIGQAQSKK